VHYTRNDYSSGLLGEARAGTTAFLWKTESGNEGRQVQHLLHQTVMRALCAIDGVFDRASYFQLELWTGLWAAQLRRLLSPAMSMSYDESTADARTPPWPGWRLVVTTCGRHKGESGTRSTFGGGAGIDPTPINAYLCAWTAETFLRR
jgi:hypothetical protein